MALQVVQHQRARDGVTKLLLGLDDGRRVETVVIPTERRTTLCVSSQVGCGIGCTFCATATLGFVRQLSPDEIVGQYIRAAEEIESGRVVVDHPIRNIVFMGMGEPFLNFDNLVTALEILLRQHGFQNHIMTVSTIGIADRIVSFGQRFPHVRLAVSLHAPTDHLRTSLVPVNQHFNLAEILHACRQYSELTGRKVFFEYVMIAGVNDSLEDGKTLGRLLKDVHGTVNLIPLNPGGQKAGAPPERHHVDQFRAAIKSEFAGHVTFRRSRGTDIDAACGQLAARTTS